MNNFKMESKMNKTNILKKKYLILLCLLTSQSVSSFELQVDAGQQSGNYSMFSREEVIHNRPSWNIRVYAPEVSSKMAHAACIQPGFPLKSGEYTYSSILPKNRDLEYKFSTSIGCAESSKKAQLLALEAFYETENKMDLTTGSVRFLGLTRAEKEIKYCDPVNWVTLFSENNQNLVVWDLKSHKKYKKSYYFKEETVENENKTHDIPEPSILLLMFLGMLGMLSIIKYKK